LIQDISKRKKCFPWRFQEGSWEYDIAEANGSWR